MTTSSEHVRVSWALGCVRRPTRPCHHACLHGEPARASLNKPLLLRSVTSINTTHMLKNSVTRVTYLLVRHVVQSAEVLGSKARWERRRWDTHRKRHTGRKHHSFTEHRHPWPRPALQMKWRREVTALTCPMTVPDRSLSRCSTQRRCSVGASIAFSRSFLYISPFSFPCTRTATRMILLLASLNDRVPNWPFHVSFRCAESMA